MKRAGPTKGAHSGIVLAHGRGGSADDILGLFAYARLPDVAAVAPDAPGQSWWPTSFLAPMAVLAPHAAAGVQALMQAVAVLEAERIARNRIWLGGFSQGACLALETFARVGEGLAGVLAFSGGLLGSDDAEGASDPALYGHAPKRFDYPGRRDGAKVWISVHERDSHIPLARAEASAEKLAAMGADVTRKVYPGAGHSVMPEDIEVLHRWLNA